MSNRQLKKGDFTIKVRNIGGISQTTVKLDRGINILAGRNATNRTSLLQALMLGLGSDRASLKGDADQGRVELVVDGEEYTRTLSRENRSILLEGDPYLDDPEVADLFAFLLEDNEARTAVTQSENLRDIIMRPIDTDAIQAEIQRLESERQDVDKELEELDALKRRLPELEERRNTLESTLEDERAELQTAQTALESVDRGLESLREEQEEFEQKLNELRDIRSQLDRLNRQIETEEESIDSLVDEREELEQQLENIDARATVDVDDVEREIGQLRERKQTLDSVVNELQHIIQFNKEMLEGDQTEIGTVLHDDNSGPVTDRLLDDEITCWTCGNAVARGQIDSTLDRLKSLRQEKLESVRDTEDRLSELRDELDSVTAQEERRATLEDRLEAVEDELTRRRNRIDDHKEKRKAASDDLEQLEREVEQLENEEFDELLAKHREVNELEFEIDSIRSDIRGVTDEIGELESRLDERETLEAERERIENELADARTRVDQIEEAAVTEFNSQIETVLDILDYSNLERVWIERVQRNVREGRRTVEQSQFELHVVRTSSSGHVYEDTVDHLSESEREVVGLVFALAGYLVHEVYETLPLIVLDSLEAIDSDRIATLVEYFSDYTDYAVVALLPEDNQAFDERYYRVDDI
jgi:chromosome segregation ATPase